MSDRFKQFVQQHCGNWNDTIEQTFIKGLTNTTRSIDTYNNLTSAIFEVARAEMSNEQDANLLDWVQKFVLSLQRNAMEVKPRVREALFFPSDQSEHRLQYWLDQAKQELLICVFTITNNHLRNKVVDAKKRGVFVRVISDDECMKQPGSDVQYFSDNGIEVEIDRNPDAHMHNKFVVIDQKILITGSFNWTVSAVNNNQENLIVLEDPELCRQYIEQYNSLWRDFLKVEASNEPRNDFVHQRDDQDFQHRGGNRRGGRRGDRGDRRGRRGDRRP